mgnify:CR=1 FL=1
MPDEAHIVVALEVRDLGVASSLSQLCRNLGSTIALASYGAVLNSQLQGRVDPTLLRAPRHINDLPEPGRTQAIDAAKDAYKVVIGSFLNIGVLQNWLLEQKKNVLFLCAGWKNKFNLEDTLFAGAVSTYLQNSGSFMADCDSAIASMYLYERGKDDLYKFLENSSHRRRLERLKIEKDIEFCLMQNLVRVIPVLDQGALISMPNIKREIESGTPA